MTSSVLALIAKTSDDSQMASKTRKIHTTVTKPQTAGLTIIGIAALGIGVSGTFWTHSTLGFTTLTVIGAGALLIATIGRWPDNFALAGGSMGYSTPTEKEIIDAFLEDLAENATSEKRVQWEKLLKEVQSPSTGKYKNYSFVEFDLELQKSLKNVFPLANLIRTVRLGSIIADYRLDFGNASILLETKYNKPGTKQFKGVTLDPLIEKFPAGEKLLVVANVEDVQIARDKLRSNIDPRRADVICWRGSVDDDRLKNAIDRLMNFGV